MKRLESGRKELTPRMKQVVQVLFDHPHETQAELAARLGISPARVGQVLRSGRVLEAFPTLAKVRIKRMVPRAVQRYGELMEQRDNPEVARKVTERVLDTGKVLDPEMRIVRHELELLPTEKVIERVRESLKVSTENVFDAELVDPDETK